GPGDRDRRTHGVPRASPARLIRRNAQRLPLFPFHSALAMKTLSLFRCTIGALALSAVASCPAWAADGFPSGPVRILVGFPAGGTIDVVAREVAEQMREQLGVPVNVENLTGAGGQLAAR